MKKIIRYKHPISGILGHYPAGMDSEVMEAMLARGSSAMDAAPRTIAPVAQDAVSRLTDSEMAMVKEAIKSVRTPARSAAPVAQDELSYFTRNDPGATLQAPLKYKRYKYSPE